MRTEILREIERLLDQIKSDAILDRICRFIQHFVLHGED